MANKYNDILASQIAEPATSDENLELYTRVAAGDTAARQEMIERNMALVLSRVDAFLQARPGYKYLRDDLVSVGSLALVQAIDQMAAGAQTEQPSGYLSAAINYNMSQYAQEEGTIKVSCRTQRRTRAESESSSQPIQEPSYCLNDCETGDNPVAVIELRDLLESCCTTQRDQACLRLLEDGHSREEIGRILGISKSYAIKLCRRIEDRFLTKEAALREADAFSHPIGKKREPSGNRLRFSL